MFFWQREKVTRWKYDTNWLVYFHTSCIHFFFKCVNLRENCYDYVFSSFLFFFFKLYHRWSWNAWTESSGSDQQMTGTRRLKTSNQCWLNIKGLLQDILKSQTNLPSRFSVEFCTPVISTLWLVVVIKLDPDCSKGASFSWWHWDQIVVLIAEHIYSPVIQ